MPIVRANSLNVEFSDSGTGPTVALIHSSVKGGSDRQDRATVVDRSVR